MRLISSSIKDKVFTPSGSDQLPTDPLLWPFQLGSILLPQFFIIHPGRCFVEPSFQFSPFSFNLFFPFSLCLFFLPRFHLFSARFPKRIFRFSPTNSGPSPDFLILSCQTSIDRLPFAQSRTLLLSSLFHKFLLSFSLILSTFCPRFHSVARNSTIRRHELARYCGFLISQSHFWRELS